MTNRDNQQPIGPGDKVLIEGTIDHIVHDENGLMCVRLPNGHRIIAQVSAMHKVTEEKGPLELRV